MVATWLAVRLWGAGAPGSIELIMVPAAVAGLLFGTRGGMATSAVMVIAVAPLWPAGPDPSLSLWALTAALATGLAWLIGVRTDLLQHAASRSDELTDRIRTTYQRTLHLISEAIELRDPATAGHSQRVGANASLLGAAIGLGEEELGTLYWAGLLHDVGKIAVPETVLHKAGALSPPEWAIIRQHPGLGATLVRRADVERHELADAVGTHHERWDGSGYPHGLEGESIPLYGRILAIVDVFEALTAARPYRAPLSPEEACKYILEGSGTKFDPALVQPFAALVREGAVVLAPVADRRATMFSTEPT